MTACIIVYGSNQHCSDDCIPENSPQKYRRTDKRCHNSVNQYIELLPETRFPNSTDLFQVLQRITLEFSLLKLNFLFKFLIAFFFKMVCGDQRVNKIWGDS